MQKFNSAGVEIAFSDEGSGQPILLIHGFASNTRVNWQSTGWIKTLPADARPALMVLGAGSGTGRVTELTAASSGDGRLLELPVYDADKWRQVVPPGSILPSGVRKKPA